ncbi:MAG TPA: hypothetical protein VGL45_02750, partial [Bradyrhizobium sp.]
MSAASRSRFTVIASEAKQSRTAKRTGLLRRFAPRNDRCTIQGHPMKLSFSPASPFARKVRIAAIELGLID